MNERSPLQVRLARRLVAGIAITLGLWVVTATGQQPSPAAQYVPGEVLVRFRQAATTPRRNAVLARRGAQLIRRFEHVDLHHVRLGRGVSVAAAVAAFRAEPDVFAVQPNFIREISASAPPNDPYWLDNTLYGLQKILAQPAWNSFPAGDATIVVADIDTGVNYSHPDLVANMWHNPGEIPGNGIDDEGTGMSMTCTGSTRSTATAIRSTTTGTGHTRLARSAP